MLDDDQSAGVERPDEVNQVILALILDLLLLHAQVVVVAVVGIDDDLVQVPDDADLRVGLHVVLSPLLQLALLDVDLRLVHDLHVEPLVLVDGVDLAVLGVLDQLEHVVAIDDDALLLLSCHVVAEDLGDDLSVQHLLELVQRVLVLGPVINQQRVELLLVDWLDIGRSDFGVGRLDALVLDLLEGFLEVGEVAGRGEEHKQVLVDVFEAAVDVGSELADELGPHVILHAEEGQELTQVVDVVERTLLLQLLRHVLLAVLVGPRLVGRQRLGDLESVIEIGRVIAILGGQIFFDLLGLFLELGCDFLEVGPVSLAVGEHGEGNFLPGGVQLLGVTDTLLRAFELIDLSDQLGLGLDVGEHLAAHEHFVEDEPRAPDVALLVILLQLEHFGRGVEGRAGAFGHLYLDVSRQSEIGYLELFVLIEEDIIGLEVAMQLIYVMEGVLSLLMQDMAARSCRKRVMTLSSDIFLLMSCFRDPPEQNSTKKKSPTSFFSQPQQPMMLGWLILASSAITWISRSCSGILSSIFFYMNLMAMMRFSERWYPLKTTPQLPFPSCFERSMQKSSFTRYMPCIFELFLKIQGGWIRSAGYSQRLLEKQPKAEDWLLGAILFMLHNNYTQQDYAPCHVILPAEAQNGRGALLLGDLNAATDQQLLAEHGVQTIITAAAGLEHLQIPAEQTHVVFPLLDLKNQNIEAYFELSYQTIEENLKRGAVLVHCGAGISRSATLVIAYYMKKYDAIFSNAIKYVRKMRPNVCPNLGFELQLKKYQEKLAAEHPPQAMSKQESQVEQQSGVKGQLEGAKQMNLTFNAPTKEAKVSRMAATNARNFTGHTPILSRKQQHASGHKRKVDEGALFIEGRTAIGAEKGQSLYDPEKYWPKGGQRRREIHSFKN